MTSQFLTPKKRISGLGSAKSGTHHFWVQRITAIANLFLSIGIVAIVLQVVGKSHIEVVTILKQPIYAFILLGFTLSVTTHMRLGMQVVIEDYVHTHIRKTLLIILNLLFTHSIALVASLAILKIALLGM